MSVWIELHADIFEHKKFVIAANELTHGDREKLVGHMCRLWTWCMDHAESGDLSHLSVRDIAAAANWPVRRAAKFVAVLLRVGLLDEGPRLHDWDDFAGRLIDRRRRDRERHREERAAQRARPPLRSTGPSEGRPSEHPMEGPQDVRVHRTEPHRTEPDRRYVPASQVAMVREHRRHLGYDAPTRRDGRLVDSTGREWSSMDDWAASIRELKAAPQVPLQ